MSNTKFAISIEIDSMPFAHYRYKPGIFSFTQTNFLQPNIILCSLLIKTNC